MLIMFFLIAKVKQMNDVTGATTFICMEYRSTVTLTHGFVELDLDDGEAVRLGCLGADILLSS